MIDDDLEVGPVKYERLAPLKQWRITAPRRAAAGAQRRRGGDLSPVAMDVTFDALTPAMGGDGQGKEAVDASSARRESVGKGHLEQAGRWSGWMEFNGQRCVLGSEARQPRQVVGSAPLGRPEDVALVLDQHRRRHALRWHPHRHRCG